MSRPSRTQPTRPSAGRAYALAVGSVLLASATRLAVSSLLPPSVTLITFYPAVMVSAWFGGWWPGLTSTLLSTAVAAYVWLPPVRSFALATRGDLFALVAFVTVGVVISALNESLHRMNARQQAARQAAEAALARELAAKAEAQAANRLKDEFLAVVSHEVRTPLNAILGWTDMLLGGTAADAAARQRALTAIYENARRQKVLIDDLLDAAQIASGTLRLHPTSVDLRKVVCAATDIVEPAAVMKRICITTELPPSVPAIVADPVRLQQIVCNLLVNAVKFTPEDGTVSVSVSGDEGTVRVRVRDTGPGIPVEFVPHVFEPFRRGPKVSPDHGGVGLGMAIVKQLVAAHGGTVEVDGGGGGTGATFTVSLPSAVAPSHGEATSAVSAAAR